MNKLIKCLLFENVKFYNYKIMILTILILNSNGLLAEFTTLSDTNHKLYNKNIAITTMNNFGSQYSNWFNLDMVPNYYYKSNPDYFQSNKINTYEAFGCGNNSMPFYYNAINDKTNNTNDRELPPLKPLRISGELVSGIGTGLVAGFGMGYLSLSMAFVAGAPAEFGSLAYGFLGFIIGYPIGSTIGVYFVGNLGDETGELWDTLLGSIIGSIGGFYFIATKTNYLPYIFLSPVGATIGFNRSRRYEKSRNNNALFNFRNNKLSINFPETYCRYSKYGMGEFTVNIIKFDF